MSCEVRTLHTGLKAPDIERVKSELADVLFHVIPAGVAAPVRSGSLAAR
jgi:tRNA-splicing ligase RtcB